jgi:DNA-binding NarL/FixJ family response regulator
MIRIFIVDDHPLLLEGIQSMLVNQKAIDVVGYAMNAQSCLEYFVHKTADVILMDINLPDMSGIDLCAEIKSRYPAVMVLALSSFREGAYIKKMIAKGANGYVLKSAGINELLDGIHEVNKGKTYLSFDAGKTLYRDNDSLAIPLTKREQQVLMLIAEGYTNPQIADTLFISLATADSHRKNLLAKLKVKNTALLIRYAMENQLI